MNSVPTKLVGERWITVYTFSVCNTRKLAFYFPAFSLLVIIFIFLTFNLNPFHLLSPIIPFKLIVFFQAFKCFINTNSSAESISSEYPDLISLYIASSTMIKKTGLNTKLWCNPTWARKFSVKVPLTLTWLQAFIYIDCIILTNHSPIPNFLKAYYTTSLCIQSKAFSKSTNANYRIFFAKYFSCNCLKITMVFIFPYTGMKPNCINCCLINFSIIFWAIF